ncbi:MAG: sensor domain-containing diguanylate cyclase [Actinomycetota bacterium]
MPGSEVEQRLLRFLYLAPVGLIEAHRNGTVINVNPMADNVMILLSGSPDISNAFRCFAGPFPDLLDRLEAFDDVGVVIDNERFELDPATGDTRNFALTVHAIEDARVALVITDVTALVAKEREVVARETELRTIVDAVQTHMIVSVDDDGCILNHNTSIGRLTGFGPEIVGQPVTALFSDDRDVRAMNEQAEDDDWTEMEASMVGPDGTTWWGSAVYTRLAGDAGTPNGFALVVREATERHAREALLEEWAYTDQLTGLATRRVFDTEVSRSLELARHESKPVSFALLDVDRFKRVNDEHGHQVGDAVLVELAKRLVATVRPGDVVVRMGGEEFGVLLVDADADEAVGIAERLRLVVSATPFATIGGELQITISGGVASWNGDSSPFAQVYAVADEALLGAKRNGRDRIVAG